jgi:hypothetical protein
MMNFLVFLKNSLKQQQQQSNNHQWTLIKGKKLRRLQMLIN